MTSSQIRQSFLDFFKSKEHTIVPSSSLMPDSPNLLFTNAGMNQFVPIFLGQTKCPYTPPRAADTQKCIRAGGKHNDLDDVGLDTYHHTFFEMLGNWSFGNYFKEDAINWAWELVADTWKFPANRLYATIFCPYLGQPGWEDKWRAELEQAIVLAKTADFFIPPNPKASPFEIADQEAAMYWAQKFIETGRDPFVHIVPGNKKDNFWMMGETGPCGPCSELHVDLTPNGDTKGSLVNQGDARCIEIWNLVFIQFNANPDGTFSPLPAKHVDTGMGFERVTSIIQGTKNFSNFANAKISNYETDIFRPIFDKLEKMSGKKYGSTLPQSGGSATVPVAPVGVPPTGSSDAQDHSRTSPSKTAARDAQQSDRDGRAPQANNPQAIYYKRRLPHFERPWAKYMVSFTTRERRQLSPTSRDAVLKSLLFGHETRRYQMFAACVMPDHVHFLFEPQIKEQDKDGKPVFWSLTDLMHSIKSFTAHEINKLEKTSGQVWENESFDRLIRGDADFEEKFHYICRNPWDSNVASMTEDYPWLWTPDAFAKAERGSVTVPVASVSVPLTDSVRETQTSSSVPSTSRALGSVARDAQQGDRDGRPPQEQIALDIAFRVIADHIRTLSFSIADGIQPGNTDRNYVLRRILRRAVRYGRTLGFHEPFFYKLVDVLAETMGDIFPEVRAKKKHVQDVIRIEEEAFNKTLDRGIELFNEVAGGVMKGSESEVPFNVIVKDDANPKHAFGAAVTWKGQPVTITGAFAFKLYDTYGFPLDLTELMARERGLAVDKRDFEKLMEEQRARARAAQKKTVIEIDEHFGATEFVGFEKLATNCQVLSFLDKLRMDGGADVFVITDRSPLYAEMGGQVGDAGQLEIEGIGKPIRIIDTIKRGSVFYHKVHPEDSAAARIDWTPVQGRYTRLAVDLVRRNAIQRHHTVTHLLHWALHEVVSKEASQKGSLVAPEKLTFDFNSAPLSPEQLSDIEKLVNERILENAVVSWTEVPHADVKSRKDVMQFFGDKYGDTVRVVQIGGRAGELNGYSMELCGGTHTRATGEIGLFRIVGESAIAAGVRRIEAVAGLEAYNRANQELQLIKSVAGKINSPIGELEKKIEALLVQQKDLEKQLKAVQQKQAAGNAKELLAKAKETNGIPAIIENLGSVDGDTLQTIADSLKSQFKGVIVLGGVANGAVSLIAAVTPEFTAKVQAGKIIQTIAPIVGGKGGGKPDNARGGGKDAGKLDEALAKVKSLLG